MVLAEDLADAVKAGPVEHQELVDAALCVGQWLADKGIPGRWDRVRPAEILAGLDFMSALARERLLFYLVGLIGHAALRAQIPAAAAKQSIDEVLALARDKFIRSFARNTSAHLATLTAS